LVPQLMPMVRPVNSTAKADWSRPHRSKGSSPAESDSLRQSHIVTVLPTVAASIDASVRQTGSRVPVVLI
jgi:hypothetical protein